MSDDTLNAAANGKLRSFIERLERLEADKEAVAEEIKECLAEARAEGFDVTTIKRTLKARRGDPAQAQEQAALDALYLGAVS